MKTLTTKHCYSCSEVKPVEAFNVCKRNKDGRQSSCKPCKKLLSQQRYLLKGEQIRNVNQAWSVLNKERHDALRLEWNKRNTNGRISQLTRSGHAPRWLNDVDKQTIKTIYKEARKQGLVVDHVIPLNGKNVCGLHIPSNLQLLSRDDNAAKYNHFN